MEQATSQIGQPQDRPAQAAAGDRGALQRALLDRVNQTDRHGALACWAEIEDADAAEASSRGLLRWAAVTPANPLAALRARFAGMGELEKTALRVSTEEYVAADTPKIFLAAFRRPIFLRFTPRCS